MGTSRIFDNSPASVIRSSQPACHWQDAYPLGNGKIGAMVYGRLAREKVLLNHEALWNGSFAPEMPDISVHLPELRRLLQEGDYAQAENFLKTKWCEHGYSFGSKTPGADDLLADAQKPTQTGSYQPAADLCIEQEFAYGFCRYTRELDLQQGIASIGWDSREGGIFERESFVSAKDDVFVMRIKGTGGCFNGALWLQAHNADIATTFGSDHPAPQDLQWSCLERENGLLYRCVRGGQPECVVQLEYRHEGGTATTEKGRLLLQGASEVVILCRIAVLGTGESPPKDFALPYDYATLRERHLKANMCCRSATRLSLNDTSRRPMAESQSGDKTAVSNEALLEMAFAGDCPDRLWEITFDYGRYLLGASSRRGSLPAHLQGVWNGDYEPAWWCGFFLNENLQMCYWPALALGMSDALLPVFDMLEAHLDDFRKNASRIYGCRGLLLPLFMDAQSGLQKNNQSHVIHWTGAGAWMCQFYFDYWNYTRDIEFLHKRAYPFMREVLAFYEDFLLEDEQGQWLFAPSNSPENMPLGDFEGSGKLSVSLNATADFALLREVLVNALAVAPLVGESEEQQALWSDMLHKIPPYCINADGALAEWMHPDFRDNYRHRHLMHLYPLFPGREITRRTHPELFNACAVALERRKVIGLQSQTGWSLAHMAALYARLQDGDRALECLEMLARSCLGNNLLTHHNDWRHSGITMDYFEGWRVSAFQMEANVGITNAILEMLVNVRGDHIHILPALPSRWRTGALTQVFLPAGRILDLQWDMGRGHLEVRLTARDTGGDVQLYAPEGFRTVEDIHNSNRLHDRSSACSVTLERGEMRIVIFTL